MFYILFFSSVVVGFFIGKIIFKVAYKDIVKKDTEAKVLKECSNLIKKQEIEKEKLSSIKEEILKEESKLNQKIDDSSIILRIKQDELEKEYSRKKEEYIKEIEKEIENWARSAQEAATINRDYKIEEFNEEIINKKKELNSLKDEINDFRTKREVINQEILRRREMEEKQDFYKIQIDEASISDINKLNSIKKELSKIDLLNKLIYDNYISKPANEMIKRILGGRAPSGIYKITRLKTGEVYIGKSTDVKSRWQQHLKSAFHCGTISHSLLHTIMEKDGIWNFTFELLEEVPKDKLTEREKHWIQFYDSKKFGLNERIG